MAFGTEFLSNLGSNALSFAQQNPALTGGLLGAGAGYLADGKQGAFLGGAGGAALGYGAGRGLFDGGGEEFGFGDDLFTLGADGQRIPKGTGNQPFQIGGAGLKELGAVTSGASDIYSTLKESEQAKDLINLQKQTINQGLLRQREADERREETQRAASAGFGNYYYA